MLFYSLSTLIKFGHVERALERLNEDAEKSDLVDIFDNNNSLIYYLCENNDYRTLEKLLEYHKKYFLDPYAEDSHDHFKNFSIAEESIGVVFGGNDEEISEDAEISHKAVSSRRCLY